MSIRRRIVPIVLSGVVRASETTRRSLWWLMLGSAAMILPGDGG